MIIALGHKSRVGKDTIALLLEEYSDQRFTNVKRCGFAWQLKETAEQLYRWAGLQGRAYYEAHPEERAVVLPKVGKTPVQLWVAVGDAMTAIHPLTLVEPVLSWLPETIPVNDALLIVSDLRRESEIDAVHARGGIVVKVVRPGSPTHVSAADDHLDRYTDWDFVLVNDGSVDALKQKVKTLLHLAHWYGRSTAILYQSTQPICPYCSSRRVGVMSHIGDDTFCHDCSSTWVGVKNREILPLGHT